MTEGLEDIVNPEHLTSCLLHLSRCADFCGCTRPSCCGAEATLSYSARASPQAVASAGRPGSGHEASRWENFGSSCCNLGVL